MKRLLAWLLVLAAGAAGADSVTTRRTEVHTLAPGVHMIRHADPTADFPDGNTTVVIGQRGVLVVDTGYLPSTARADIERIRAWTDKPVRWVVNTHWHNDHVGGNAAYLAAFPGAEVIAHRETRTLMELRIRSYVVRFVADDTAFGRQRAQQRRMLDSGVDEQGAPLADARRAELADTLARDARAVEEFRRFVYQGPTLTFDDALTIDLGDREAQLRHLGRGNTAGDVVVVLPRERILIAGDLVDHPVPYAFGGYPSDWSRTLKRLAQIEVDMIVPGHGELLRGSAYLQRLIALLDSLIARTTALLGERGSALTLEVLKREIDLAAWRRELAGDDADSQAFFDASMASLLGLVLAEAKAR